MSDTSRIRIGAAAAVPALVAVGAGWWWLQPSPPIEGPRRYAFDAPPLEIAPSRVTLPVLVSFADLAQSIEARVPEQLMRLEAEPVSDDWLLDLALDRPGPVAARGEDRTLRFEVPLRLNAKAYRAKRAARRAERGKGAPEGIGLDFDGLLDIAVDLDLADDWSLLTETVLDIRWLQKPMLDVGPLRIPVAKPVQKVLDDTLAEVGATVDRELAEKNPTKRAVDEAWTRLSAPIALSEDPPLWLVAQPTALYASDVRMVDEGLTLDVGYHGALQTVLGTRPDVTPTTLPARTDPPESEAGFSVNLPLVLQWEALSQSAMAQLGDQQFALDEGQLTWLRIGGLELYPSGENVAVRLDYEVQHPGGSTEGIVFFLARPELDPEARQVRLADFSYVLQTADRSLLAADALARTELQEAIQERLEFSYGERLDAAVMGADAALRQGRTTQDGGTAQGSLNAIDVRQIEVREHALVLQLQMSGDGEVRAVPKADSPVERPPVDLDLARPPGPSKGR